MASPFDPQHSGIVSRIYHYADMYGIPRNVAVWQIWQESRFNPRAVSPAGAKGIAQFMPATAARFGVNVFDIESSLNGWGKYMRWLLGRSYIGGRIEFALGGYNAGEGRIQQYNGLPPFRETQNYVATIMRNAGASAGDIGANILAIAGGGGSAAGISAEMLLIGGLLLILLVTD